MNKCHLRQVEAHALQTHNHSSGVRFGFIPNSLTLPDMMRGFYRLRSGMGICLFTFWEGYLPWRRERYLPWRGHLLWTRHGIPSLERDGYLPWMGRVYLPWMGRYIYLGMGRGTYLGWGGVPTEDGEGVPT